jgi:hypothetical protein
MNFLSVSILACDQSHCDRPGERHEKPTRAAEAKIGRYVLTGMILGRETQSLILW